MGRGTPCMTNTSNIRPSDGYHQTDRRISSAIGSEPALSYSNAGRYQRYHAAMIDPAGAMKQVTGLIVAMEMPTTATDVGDCVIHPLPQPKGTPPREGG